MPPSSSVLRCIACVVLPSIFSFWCFSRYSYFILSPCPVFWDHYTTRHLKVFCSRRRTSDEGDAEEWVTCESKNENIPLALSTTISPTSTTPQRAASCTFPCLRRNGLAKCFFSTHANRSRLILSSVSVDSDGSRSTISMPGSCSSGCSWRECSNTRSCAVMVSYYQLCQLPSC